MLLMTAALIGAGGMWAQAQDTLGLGESASGYGYAIRGGGGLDLYLSDRIATSVGVTYVLPGGQVEDLDYLSIGWGLLVSF